MRSAIPGPRYNSANPSRLCLLAAVSLLLAVGGGTVTKAQTFTGMNLGPNPGPGGDPSLAGSIVNNGDGTLTITGGGDDIWNQADACYYCYTTKSGQNWSALVRVQDFQAVDWWSKCEILIRQPDGVSGMPQPGDPFIASMTTASSGQNEMADQFRTARNGLADWWSNASQHPAYPNAWMGVCRAGKIFYVLFSTNSVHWQNYLTIDTSKNDVVGQVNGTTFGTATGGTGWTNDQLYVGLAVTAHNNSDPTGAKAITSNLQVQNSVPPTALGAAVQVQNATNYQGEEVSFSFQVTNNAAPDFYVPAYQWYKSGAAIAGATGTQHTFLASAADAGVGVYCVATLPATSLTLNSATGTITLLPGAIMITNGLKVEFWAGAGRTDVEAGNVAPAGFLSRVLNLDLPNDGMQNYTRRLSGWFLPNTTTNYIFFVAADDDTDLFLSTDSTPEHKQLIAQEVGWSPYRSYLTVGGPSWATSQKRSDQWTNGVGVAPLAGGIPLTAGRLYYLEVVHHQGVAGDNLSVTYSFSGQAAPTNGASSLLQQTNNNLVLITSPTVPLTGQSQRPGWGATPYADSLGTGVTFRVWAPNASAVTVAGVFNGWSVTANPLAREGTAGLWSADITNARVGQEYKYYFNNGTCASNSWRRDPRSRKVNYLGNYNSVIYDPQAFNWGGDNFTAPALSDAVVYELHIGSFYSPNGPNTGTFSNAVLKLDQLQQLGISAVEVLPITEFQNAPSSGYNPSDPFAVNCAYGGPDGFKYFVQACHQRGMAVLVDVVHNHYGPQNLDLWDFDCWEGGGNGGGIYFYQQTGLCCSPWGPRPNYAQLQVASFIQDTFRMWLDEYHVDGFRWDTPYDMMYTLSNNTTVFIPEAQSLIQQINAMIQTQYNGKITIAENYGTGNGFDSDWSSPFFQTMLPQLTNSLDSQRSMSAAASAVSGSGADWGRVIFMENHDTASGPPVGGRLPAKISPTTPTDYAARKRSTLGVALTLTSPGIPMMLQGEEMLTTSLYDSANPLDWTLARTYAGMVWLYKDLVRLRRNLDGLSSGLAGANVNVLVADDANKILVYHRWNSGASGDDVLVMANFAGLARTNYSITFPKSGTWYAHFNSDSSKYASDYSNLGSSVVSGGGNPLTAPVTIAPYSILIFSQVPPPAMPSTPSLSATAVSGNQINLTWSPASGAIFYALKRAGVLIGTMSATNFSDTGLAPGTAYCYTVAAVRADSVSPDSAAVCASTFGPNLWLNPGSGKWETASNWSAGTPAQLGQWALFITNANTKTVTIDSVTTNTPGSLTISNLTLSAPAGATNLLLLTNSVVPLQILNKLTVGSGGRLALAGSGLLSLYQTVNWGLIQADNSTLTFSDNVFNYGTIRVFNGSVWESFGSVINYGVIDLINGGLTNFHGPFYNYGIVLDASSVRISNVSLAGEDVRVAILSAAGHTYQLQVSFSLWPADWSNQGAAQPGTGGLLTFTDPGAATNQITRFYRLQASAP